VLLFISKKMPDDHRVSNPEENIYKKKKQGSVGKLSFPAEQLVA
jgi:hypothetical protein